MGSKESNQTYKDPQDVASFDPKCLTGRIYVGEQWTLLNTKTLGVGLIVSKKIFEVFPIISLWKLYVAMATRISL